MLYTTLGGTGERVSRLGFGGMRFEAPHRLDDMAEIVVHAAKRDIRYFDTAPDYCESQSESIFGRAFREMRRQNLPFLVSSKTMCATPGAVRRQCEQSLKRLQVDAIDFYHVWCLVQPEDLPERKGRGVLRAFRQLKEEGLIRHISVSTHLEHDKIEAMLDEGEGLFENMLIGLNVQNFHLRYKGVQAAARRGLGVVTMNTLGGGLLTRYPERFQGVMGPSDTSMVDTALRFNLSLPEVQVALIGFRNARDVDEAAEAVARFEALPLAETEALGKLMSENYREFCTQCGYCRDCPADIPVVRLMEAHNLGMLEGMHTALQHLRDHWNVDDVAGLLEPCTQCRRCEEECTQHLPILERFDALRRVYESSIRH